MTPTTAVQLQKWLEERKLYPYYAAGDAHWHISGIADQTAARFARDHRL